MDDSNYFIVAVVIIIVVIKMYCLEVHILCVMLCQKSLGGEEMIQ
jgi:hypothetical protein